MPFGFVSAAVAVGGLIVQNKARKDQKKQQQQALDQQSQQFDKQLKASDPFGPERAQYAKQLQDLMTNPGSVKDLPGYQFQMDQGTDAITRQAAANGFLGSGNLGAELEKYGQGLASSFYDKRLSLLSSLAGAGAVPGAPNNPGAGAGIAAANNNYSATGDLLTSAGYLSNLANQRWGSGSFNSGSSGGLGAGGGMVPTSTIGGGSGPVYV